jgi:hypothetical protein
VGTTAGQIGASRAGGMDAVAVSLTANGDPRWTSQWGTAEDDLATAIIADSSGVHVIEPTYGAITKSVGGSDIFISELDDNGNITSTNQFGTKPDDGTDSFAEPSLYAASTSAGISIVGDTYGSTQQEQNAGSADVFILTPTLGPNRMTSVSGPSSRPS